MPTREVLSQFAQSESEATGLGPVQDTTDPTPQSLLERHQNLAARPNNPTYHPPAPSNDGAPQASQASQPIRTREMDTDSVGNRIGSEVLGHERHPLLLLRLRRR
ncbi:hypothetical protein BKA56DRAFT_618834 [Ilyonectria sp. MPI-CAGE-AT-0026]|nr:hypothetical protein BKA56DRAFT_618834 [Ilyonectria sp. MPI-CAGE-AT-0026]